METDDQKSIRLKMALSRVYDVDDDILTGRRLAAFRRKVTSGVARAVSYRDG